MDSVNPLRKLVCIRYPGIVENVEKSIKTIGGTDAIAKVHVSKNKRLELRFRQDDPYCKPACSSKHKARCLLLKIKVKKKVSIDTSVHREILSTEIIGVIDTIHKFENLADFQYLPIVQDEETKKMKCILKDLIPPCIIGSDFLTLQKSYYLTPPLFSRNDTPYQYAFRSHFDNDSSDITQKICGVFRKKRANFTYCVQFSHGEPAPTKPNKNALELLKNTNADSLSLIQKFFEERPIWSKIELLHISKLKNDELKFILPNIAYYFTSGPWRILWIKFGYDPCKDSQSRIYQNIDYRVKNIGGLKTVIQIHRDPHRDGSIYQNKKASETFIENKENISENYYVFRSETLPPKRQMFYQYCNIKISEIEEMLLKLGEILPGALCHEQRGWMPAGFSDQCRSHMDKYVLKRVQELRFENSSDMPSAFDIEEVDDDLTMEDLHMDVFEPAEEQSSEAEDNADI